jgi:hypothetical protein
MPIAVWDCTVAAVCDCRPPNIATLIERRCKMSEWGNDMLEPACLLMPAATVEAWVFAV